MEENRLSEKFISLCESGDTNSLLKFLTHSLPGADEYKNFESVVMVSFGQVVLTISKYPPYEIVFHYDGPLVKKYPQEIAPSEREAFLSRYLLALKRDVSYRDLAKYWFPTDFVLIGLVKYIFVKKNLKSLVDEYEELLNKRRATNNQRLSEYNDYANSVNKFDALNFEDVKHFAGTRIKINRNGIYY